MERLSMRKIKDVMRLGSQGLSARKIATVEGTRITIGDRVDLERIARPNPLIDDFTV